jgi:hypothetical protein
MVNMSDNTQAAANTDKELWRTVEGDYYSKHKLYLTESGGLTLCEGGTCITLPPEDWFKLAGKRFQTVQPVDMSEVERVAKALCAFDGEDPMHQHATTGRYYWVAYADEAKIAIGAMKRESGEEVAVLPYTVNIGATTFRKGVKLATVIEAANRWYQTASDLIQKYEKPQVLPAFNEIEGDKP